MKKALFFCSNKYLLLKKFFTGSIILFLFTLNTQVSFAQSTKGIEWKKCIGGTKDDEANDVLLNPDGTMVVVGYSKSNDGDVSGHHGSLDTADAWIAKLDASGNLLWQKSVSGTNNDVFNTVISTGDGNYLCIGYTYSTDGDIAINGNNGSADYVVVKISKDGNII
jgi:hypothetical protein